MSAPQRVSESMNIFISRVLRVGVLTSAAVIGLGLVLFLVTHRTGYGSGDLSQLIEFGTEGVFPTGLADVVRGAVALKPFAIIMLGLAMLIATPVVRVAASVIGFAVERDRLYVVITVFVLAVILIAFSLGTELG